MLLCLLVSCGGGDPTRTADDSSPATSASSTPSSAATSATSDVVPVSMSTACQLLGADNVLTRAQKEIQAFIDHPDLSHNDPAKLHRISKDFEDVAVRAPERLAVQLRAMSEPMQTIADVIETQENQSIDLQGYRAGGIEVIHLCGPKAL
jgi:hypothetical protein